MISAVLATLNDERRLGETLAALVPAAVDGLVRQVIIADAGSTDQTGAIADDCGATIVTGDLQAGLAEAREAWVLVLDAGARLPPGWDREVRAQMAGGDRPGVIRIGPRRGLLSLMAPPRAVGLLARLGDLGAGVTVAELTRAARSPATLKIAARLAD